LYLVGHFRTHVTHLGKKPLSANALASLLPAFMVSFTSAEVDSVKQKFAMQSERTKVAKARASASFK
jgi:hypothetical protein